MATKLPAVDVVLVGFGWTGAILGQELTDAGLRCWRSSAAAGATRRPISPPTFTQDELRYYYRDAAVPGAGARDPHLPQQRDQTALPMRQLGSFLPGTGVGGAGIHWNGQTWRFLPTDFMARSHNDCSATARRRSRTT